MIDINNEELIPLKQVAKIIPSTRTGKSIHIATVYRWASKGRRGPVLDTVKVGGCRYTTASALRRFVCPQEKARDEMDASSNSPGDREARTKRILFRRGLR